MKHTIYQVTSKKNGKIYIGAHSTDNPDDNYYGSGKLILRALEKYGIQGFDKEILHILDTKEEMYAKEAEIVTQEFVDRQDTYNVNIGGSAPPVTVHTEESRARISRQSKGRRWTDEQKRKMSNTKKNGYHPYRGKKLTEEHKEKNRLAQLGRKHTKETKVKMSANMTGENNPNYGRTFSPEYRAKLSAAHKGRKHTPETLAKMSAARKKYYTDKKNRQAQSKRMIGNKNSQREPKDKSPTTPLAFNPNVIMIGADYDHPDIYRGIEIYKDKNEVIGRFDTGNFDNDILAAKEFIKGLGGVAMYDSSIEMFKTI